MATRSQLLAYAQSASAVEVEIPSASAACSIVRPAKKRNFTNSALRGSFAANLSSASFNSNRSTAGLGSSGSMADRLIR